MKHNWHFSCDRQKGPSPNAKTGVPKSCCYNSGLLMNGRAWGIWTWELAHMKNDQTWVTRTSLWMLGTFCPGSITLTSESVIFPHLNPCYHLWPFRNLIKTLVLSFRCLDPARDKTNYQNLFLNVSLEKKRKWEQILFLFRPLHQLMKLVKSL